MEPRLRTAIYLVGQGPYREPRLIEVQYLRILRYLEALGEVLQTRFERLDVFVDLNFPRESYGDASRFPQLMELSRKLSNGEYDAVVVDIAVGRAFHPYENMPVLKTLEQHANVRVYNCYYDDEKAMARMLEKQYGIGAASYVPHGHEDDFVALFPALAAAACHEAFARDAQGRDRSAFEALSRRLQSLQEENPYARGAFPPLFSNFRRHELAEAMRKAEAERREARRKTDHLFRVAPDGIPLLVDEDLDFGLSPRDAESLSWAEQRVVNVLGFEKMEDDRVLELRKLADGLLVFADIRARGRTRFRLYDPARGGGRPDGGRQRTTGGREPALLGTFDLPDAWVNDLPSKLAKHLSRLAESGVRG